MTTQRLSWGDAADLLDGYELIKMLHVHSFSEGARVTGSFAVSVYQHPSGALLYVRADPYDPAGGCVIGPELDLPSDAQLGEPYSDAFVKALAEGEKRLRNHDKPPEPQGESN